MGSYKGHRERAWVTDADNWTRLHLAASDDERRTLCGRKIPTNRVIYDMTYNDVCKTCRNRADAENRVQGEER